MDDRRLMTDDGVETASPSCVACAISLLPTGPSDRQAKQLATIHSPTGLVEVDRNHQVIP